jgi:hypothetical protein
MGTITLSKLNTWAKGKTFVETGSMEGWTMLIAQEYGFEVMHGIELMPKYYESSKIGLKNHSNVKFWLGESPDVLRELCPTLTEPATFWLDAHASGPNIPGGIYGGNPLVQELEAIALSPCKEHVLMIDDVRLFGCSEWGGLTKQPVIDAIYRINKDYKITYIDGEDNGSLPGDILVAYIENKA